MEKVVSKARAPGGRSSSLSGSTKTSVAPTSRLIAANWMTQSGAGSMPITGEAPARRIASA